MIEKDSISHIRHLYKQSGLPKKVSDTLSLENWVDSKDIPFDVLKSVVFKGNKWLFLSGSTGAGKTYLSLVACQLALLMEKSVYFTNVTSLLMDLRPSQLDPTKPELIMKHCLAVDLLVLDDIGHEKSSEWVRETLYKIINHRWENGKQMIFTSNFSIENLKETVSPAVYSRVRGESNCFAISTKQDLRLQK